MGGGSDTDTETRLTMDKLKTKLGHRNDLLDVIRKAHYRDVIAIKEHLLTAEKQGIVVDTAVLSSILKYLF